MGIEKIDHKYTDEIVCPYCGYKESDSWEYNHNSDDMECTGCGKKFHYERNIEVTYTTNKIEP